MPKKIIFCLPGSSFSKEFVQCWSNLLVGLSRLGYQVQASFAYDPNVFYARSRCLCLHTKRGVKQKPFNGENDYDYLFWIDSDVLFSTEDVVRLINHDVDIVSGAYIMHDNQHYPIVQTLDHKFFLEHGHYKFLDRATLEALQKKQELVPVGYIGFGFMCVKKGVFESMDYPYFAPRKITFDTEDLPPEKQVVEWASEDVSWCLTARDLGYKVLLDPNVTVSHQKIIPLK